MRELVLGIVAAALLSSPAAAKIVEQRIGYEIDGKKFESVLVYDDSVRTKRPAVLMMPDWDGVDPKSVGQAKLVAGKRYVVFVADMFGVGYKPIDSKEKREASSGVHKDLALTRVRGNKIKGRVLVLHGADDPVTPKKAIDALQDELTAAKVPWQTVMFSGAVHSFTDPTAQRGSSVYDEKLARRSYAMMRDFFSESF